MKRLELGMVRDALARGRYYEEVDRSPLEGLEREDFLDKTGGKPKEVKFKVIVNYVYWEAVTLYGEVDIDEFLRVIKLLEKKVVMV